jgi:hypothetical protein
LDDYRNYDGIRAAHSMVRPVRSTLFGRGNWVTRTLEQPVWFGLVYIYYVIFESLNSFLFLIMVEKKYQMSKSKIKNTKTKNWRIFFCKFTREKKFRRGKNQSYEFCVANVVRTKKENW